MRKEMLLISLACGIAAGCTEPQTSEDRAVAKQWGEAQHLSEIRDRISVGEFVRDERGDTPLCFYIRQLSHENAVMTSVQCDSLGGRMVQVIK